MRLSSGDLGTLGSRAPELGDHDLVAMCRGVDVSSQHHTSLGLVPRLTLPALSHFDLILQEEPVYRTMK